MQILTPSEIRASGDLHWDEYRLFHVHRMGHRIAMFETGECSVITGYGRLTSDDTGVRNSLQAGFLSTTDMSVLKNVLHGAPLLTPDGERVTQAGLNLTTKQSSDCQHLWADLDHRMIVGFERRGMGTNGAPADWPDHIRRRGGVYYPSPKAKPQGAHVRYTAPRRYTAEENAQLRELKAACKAWAQMKGLYLPEDRETFIPKHTRDELDAALNLDEKPNPWLDHGHWTREPMYLCQYLGRSFNELTSRERWHLAAPGLEKQRVERKLPYLTW